MTMIMIRDEKVMLMTTWAAIRPLSSRKSEITFYKLQIINCKSKNKNQKLQIMKHKWLNLCCTCNWTIVFSRKPVKLHLNRWMVVIIVAITFMMIMIIIVTIKRMMMMGIMMEKTMMMCTCTIAETAGILIETKMNRKRRTMIAAITRPGVNCAGVCNPTTTV